MPSKREKPLNILEIAKLAGTSKSTVSRVLQKAKYVSAETRARVEHIIRAHNYQPNILARGLVGARTGLIGVLGRWLESGFSAEVIRGINDEVDRHGGRLLCSFAPGIEEYLGLWRMFVRGGHVDGVILIAPPADIYSAHIEPGDKPTVLCASKPDKVRREWDGVGWVVLDNERGMRELVDYLAGRGYRRLVCLGGPPDNLEAQERCRVFTRAVGALSGVRGKIVQGAWTDKLGYDVVSQYLKTTKSRPDAFLAWNDGVALGVLEAVRQRGLRVPEDVAVTGWDDVPFCACAGLTTVHLPMQELGQRCAHILFEAFESRGSKPPSRVTLTMPLTARETASGRVHGSQ